MATLTGIRSFAELFNHAYFFGGFLDLIVDIMKNYDGYGHEYTSANYPDWNDPSSKYHFEEGIIRIDNCDDEGDWVDITERQFFRYAKQACLRFVELHPEHRDFVMNIVDNWKPKYPDKFPD